MLKKKQTKKTITKTATQQQKVKENLTNFTIHTTWLAALFFKADAAF